MATSHMSTFSRSRSVPGSCSWPETNPRTNVRQRAHECATCSHKLRTDTTPVHGYGPRMRKRFLIVSFVLAIAQLVALGVAADEEGRFRRTTPRGSFGRDGPELLVGVPGGRAWGIESELLPVPADRSAVRATVEVRDTTVREAFVRVAWYARATGRPRQFALSDATLVRAGETVTLEIGLDPPPGAVAYRLRVLARLRAREELSVADAVSVRLSAPF